MRIAHLLLILVFTFSSTIAQERVKVLRQQSLAHWRIGTANYSGITPLGNNRYALVSDKEPTEGFYIFHILLDTISGKVRHVHMEGWKGDTVTYPLLQYHEVYDNEAICYSPISKTVFIARENDQRILEYTLTGQPTGRELTIPKVFQTIVKNNGFESLTYSPSTQQFWTTTEQTLPIDGAIPSVTHPNAINLLRLQSFGTDLSPKAQYAYRMDRAHKSSFGKIYINGVSDLCALPDGRLIVMEREVNIRKHYLGSKCIIRLYLVNPSQGIPIIDDTPLSQLIPKYFLQKQFLTTFTTRIHTFNFANYEGMCLGPLLADGRQTLLLINDSQAGIGNSVYHFKDYIKVIILPSEYGKK